MGFAPILQYSNTPFLQLFRFAPLIFSPLAYIALAAIFRNRREISQRNIVQQVS
jgi:hypothetical protein